MIKFEIMKVVIPIVLIIVSCFAVIISCKKPNGNTITGGGKGGNATIIVTPEIYDFFVDTCTIYIKYGTLDAPANGQYDDSLVCVLVNDTPVAQFKNLTVGLYYLYGVGYHSIGGHFPNVKGAKSCTISKEAAIRLWIPTYPYQL